MYNFIVYSGISLLCLCHLSNAEIDRRLLIRMINEKQSTWTAGENFPKNMTIDSLKVLNGALGIYPDDNFKMEIKKYKMTKTSIPVSFDAREAWSHCRDVIEDIRNQGGCGSCWAFAAAEAFSDRLCIKSKGEDKFQFSPQDLLECCKDCVSSNRDTCVGGYLGVAWQYWTKRGVVSGGDFDSKAGCKPYSASAFSFNKGPTTCKSACDNISYKKKYNDDKKYGTSAYGIDQDVQQIQTEIINYGPVTAIYQVYEDFYNYKYGVYQHVEGRFVGNHAVKIVGWGVEKDIPYWLVANSWGKDWGDLNGFFKILRGRNHCRIEESVVAGNSSTGIHISLAVLVIFIIVVILGIDT